VNFWTEITIVDFQIPFVVAVHSWWLVKRLGTGQCRCLANLHKWALSRPVSVSVTSDRSCTTESTAVKLRCLREADAHGAVEQLKNMATI